MPVHGSAENLLLSRPSSAASNNNHLARSKITQYGLAPMTKVLAFVIDATRVVRILDHITPHVETQLIANHE
jgi:hypothetical protein